MPRYFFHVVDSEDTIKDNYGVTLIDDDAARREALHFQGMLPKRIKVVVQDEIGRVVCEIHGPTSGSCDRPH